MWKSVVGGWVVVVGRGWFNSSEAGAPTTEAGGTERSRLVQQSVMDAETARR